VWFAGVHSDVGGGYEDMGLSDEALMWLVNRAKACGLVFNQGYLDNIRKIQPNAKDKLHDSFSWAYKVLQRFKPFHRPIGQADCRGAMLDESVLTRLADPSLKYQPENLLKSNKFDADLIKHEHGREVFDNGEITIPIYRERKSLRMMLSDESAKFVVNGISTIQGVLADYTGDGGCKLKMAQPIPALQNGSEGEFFSKTTGYKKAVVAWCADGDMGLRFIEAA